MSLEREQNLGAIYFGFVSLAFVAHLCEGWQNHERGDSVSLKKEAQHCFICRLLSVCMDSSVVHKEREEMKSAANNSMRSASKFRRGGMQDREKPKSTKGMK